MRKYVRLWDQIEPTVSTELPFVSVVVAFRNEEANLNALLSAMEAQDYPMDKWELILMNDHSTDGGVACIERRNLCINHTVVNTVGQGKKAAIKEAWGIARHECIVHTDADCSMGPLWLQSMAAPLATRSTDFVAGPVRYRKQTTFFQRLLGLEFAGLVAIGGAHIQWGNAMICNGANLAYKRKWIDSLDLHESRASGEDVFLMKSIAVGGGHLSFCKDTKAMVDTDGPENVNRFVQQRLRWASKNTAYAGGVNNAILITTWFWNCLLLVSLLLMSKIALTVFVFCVLIKFFAEEHFYRNTAAFFGLKKVWLSLFFGQLFHILYIALLPLASKLFKYKWKERKWS